MLAGCYSWGQAREKFKGTPAWDDLLKWRARSRRDPYQRFMEEDDDDDSLEGSSWVDGHEGGAGANDEGGSRQGRPDPVHLAAERGLRLKGGGDLMHQQGAGGLANAGGGEVGEGGDDWMLALQKSRPDLLCARPAPPLEGEAAELARRACLAAEPAASINPRDGLRDGPVGGPQDGASVPGKTSAGGSAQKGGGGAARMKADGRGKPQTKKQLALQAREVKRSRRVRERSGGVHARGGGRHFFVWGGGQVMPGAAVADEASL